MIAKQLGGMGVALWVLGLVWAGSEPVLAQTPLPAGLSTTTRPVEGRILLQKYDAAIQALPQLPNLQFRQQVQVTGSQEFVATLDVLYRRDGSWQAWLAQGDKIRLLDSRELQIVNQSDLLRLYSVYVSKPETLLPQVGFNINAPAGRYAVIEANQSELNGQPVNHLRLQPVGEGQLRELWLDPKTNLPRQALLYLSGVWGTAFALVTFDQVPLGQSGQIYLLPQAMRINLGYGFFTLQGLSRRDFTGSLAIQHNYQNFQVLPDGASLRFRTSEPPVDRPPLVEGTQQGGSPPLQAGQIRALGRNAAGIEEFSIGIGSQDPGRKAGESPLSEQIKAFNLTRPASRNPLSQFDTLAILALGRANLPLYLFQFDTGVPIAPLQPTNPRGRFDPSDPWNKRAPSFNLLSN